MLFFFTFLKQKTSSIFLEAESAIVSSCRVLHKTFLDENLLISFTFDLELLSIHFHLIFSLCFVSNFPATLKTTSLFFIPYRSFLFVDFTISIFPSLSGLIGTSRGGLNHPEEIHGTNCSGTNCSFFFLLLGVDELTGQRSWHGYLPLLVTHGNGEVVAIASIFAFLKPSLGTVG